MPKLDLNTVMGILQANQTPPQLLKKIENGLNEAAKEEDEEKTLPEDQPEYEPLLITTAGDGPLNEDSPFFLLDYDTKRMNHIEAIDNFKRVIWDHNDKVKSKKKYAVTIGEAFQYVPGVLLKQHGFKIRYKTPIILSRSENDLPEQG
jgi:hypothetical protein